MATLQFLCFWLHCTACGILVPQPGIEPTPPALEVWSLNHWTAKEVLHYSFLIVPPLFLHFLTSLIKTV